MDRIGPKTPPRLFVREWMVKRQVDQRRVAERLECEEGTVSKLLTGKMKMTINWLAGFAYALDVEITELYRHPDRPTANELMARVPPEKRDQAIEYLTFLATGTEK